MKVIIDRVRSCRILEVAYLHDGRDLDLRPELDAPIVALAYGSAESSDREAAASLIVVSASLLMLTGSCDGLETLRLCDGAD